MSEFLDETVPLQFPIFAVTRAGRLGSFAELGGEISFYGNWEPAQTHGDNDDPYTAAARMLTIAGYTEATEVPLELSRQIAIRDTKEHFDKQEDPEGEPWEELDPEYRRAKLVLQYPDEILHRSGLLEERATSQEAWLVIGEALVFDPFVLPQTNYQGEPVNYGKIMQEGRASDFASLGKKGEETFPGSGERYEKDVHVGLPPRPFIGLSDHAIEEITAVFATWFGETGTIFGEIGLNVRGAFPVIGHTPTGQPRLSTGQFGKKY
jgi:Phage virion morphogenesis family